MVRNDIMRTLSDMPTVGLPAAGHLLHFELAVAYEIFGNPPRESTGGWYDVLLCGPGPGPVRVGPFTVEPDHGLERLAEADTVIVPACADIDEPPPPELVEAVRAAHAAGARVASLCTGAFVLGAAGLLDGRRATTHWAHAEELSTRHPLAVVDPDVLPDRRRPRNGRTPRRAERENPVPRRRRGSGSCTRPRPPAAGRRG